MIFRDLDFLATQTPNRIGDVRLGRVILISRQSNCRKNRNDCHDNH